MNGKTILLFVMVLMLTTYAFGQHFDREADFRWERIGNSIKITEYIGQNTQVRIPPQIRGLLVTEIDNSAFMARGLVSVSIPDHVVTIREHAFSGNQLVEVKLGSRVMTIGYAAFFDNRITRIDIPNSVVTIEDHAFNKNQLFIVEIPNSVINVGSGAFANNRITNVVLGNRVRSIGEHVFDNNYVTNITISNGISVIHGNVFAGTFRSISRIVIGSNVNIRASVPADVVWEGFRNAYSANGHRAGAYTLQNDGRWGFQAN